MISRLDHVQIAGPIGCEPDARGFYGDLLGMHELPKPLSLQARGGVWFQAGDAQLHIGIEEPFSPALKAHPAFAVADLWALKTRLKGAGVSYISDTAIPGVDRLYVADPFGNRLEFLQPEPDDATLLQRHDLSLATLNDDSLRPTKRLIATVVRECFGRHDTSMDVDTIVNQYDADNHFDDMDNHRQVYAPPAGVFLLLVSDEARIIGCGAVRRLDDETAELKRMWFLPDYRGKGLGRLMARRLIAFSREAGYARIRLDTGSNLHRAVALYQGLGFRPIENYNGSRYCDVFMELTLK